MQSRTVTCPVCGKSFEIGETLSKVTCNFCGKIFEVPHDNENETDAVNETAGKACLTDAVDVLTPKITGLENARDAFSRKKYPESFNAYYLELHKSLVCLDGAYGAYAGDKSVLIKEYAEEFANKIKGGAGVTEFKQLKNSDFEKVVYLYVAFAVPAVLKFNAEYSDELADDVLLTWNRENKKRKLGKATFETLNEGFKKKWCFITTAVCNSLKKPDDCFELTSFRNFRDSYLAKQPGGKEQIQEYYIIAPLIVNAIDKSADRENVYKNIWSNHLSKCLEYYKRSEYENCRKGYTDMVSALREKWL